MMTILMFKLSLKGIKHFFKEHFSWNPQEGIILEYLRLIRNGNIEFEDFTVEGKIFEKDEKTRTAYPQGNSQVIAIPKKWADPIGEVKVVLGKISNSSLAKDGSLVIIIYPAKNEKQNNG